MRLICPNCEAQYDVPGSAIPPDGRDVQCSNCGHIWFMTRDARAMDDGQDDWAPDDTAAAPRPRKVPKMQARPYPSPDETPPKRALSDEVKAVLQQEAEREIAARRAEANDSFVVQHELGLDAGGATLGTGSKKDRLPDIEDIDRRVDERVTLPRQDDHPISKAHQPHSHRPKDPLYDPRKGRRRFQAGFWLAIVLLAGAVAIYVFAEDLAAQWPQAAEVLQAYAVWVDGLRLWLTEQAGRAEIWLSDALAGPPPEDQN